MRGISFAWDEGISNLMVQKGNAWQNIMQATLIIVEWILRFWKDIYITYINHVFETVIKFDGMH